MINSLRFLGKFSGVREYFLISLVVINEAHKQNKSHAIHNILSFAYLEIICLNSKINPAKKCNNMNSFKIDDNSIL